MFWPNFLLLLFLVVVVVPGCCLLVPVVVPGCCLLVPVGGACWWLLFVCVWWVCSRFLGLSPGRPFPWTAQNFALFFSLSRRKFLSFFSLWEVFSLNFGGVFEDRGTFGLSGCRVEPGGPTRPGRRGFTRQPENSKRAHLSVPALQTPPKFHEKRPTERRKNEISGGREQKKREILGPHPFGPPPLRAPTPPGPHPSGPHPSGPPPKTKLAKCGQQKLAKFGQIRMAKCGQLTLTKCGIGQIRFGQMRPNKDGQIRFGQMRSRPPITRMAGDEGCSVHHGLVLTETA